MQCIICGSSTRLYFSKDFYAYGLDKVHYWQCCNCGFTISKTHVELSPKAWAALNNEYHALYQGRDFNPDDPRWISRLQSQAVVLSDAVKIGLLDRDGQWLDYACGDGKLSVILKREHNLNLLKYDKYMSRQEGYLRENDITPSGFDFVITTSVFEHFTLRDQFNFVESLVAQNGVFGIHTLVCENIPADPAWFYLLPVHCAFHTNKSMSFLFKQWGYRASVYNVEARLWLWFKNNPEHVEAIIENANTRPDGPLYIYKNDFVDYWK